MFGDDDAGVTATVEWFSNVVTPIDRVVSFHRPARAVLGRDFAGVTDAYAPPFFVQGQYFSDSRRSSDFFIPLASSIADGVTPLQVLLHPEWWYPVTTWRNCMTSSCSVGAGSSTST